MNPRIRKLWVKALRSGEYAQGTGTLVEENDHTQFCCLGVLTNLYVEETGDSSAWYAVPKTETVAAILENSVVGWAELDDEDPMLGDDYASTLNDSGKSFDEIADLIEKHL